MLSAELPLFITVVVALSLLLLLLAFRSFVVPATAAAMNLIAVASSSGVLVLISQWGVGSDLLGVGKGPIEAFVLRTMLMPALMHLFGASNWWLPSWLDRILPRLTVEGAVNVRARADHAGRGPPGAQRQELNDFRSFGGGWSRLRPPSPSFLDIAAA